MVAYAEPATGQRSPHTASAGRSDSAATFSFPSVRGKKVAAALHGGRLTSDNGMLAQAERMMGICGRLWCVLQALPRTVALARAEFTTLRLRLLKVAAGVMESAARIRIAFASSCLDTEPLRAIVLALKPAPTRPVRQCRRNRKPSPSTRKAQQSQHGEKTPAIPRARSTPPATAQTPSRLQTHYNE